MPDVIQIAIEAIDHASNIIGGVGSSLDKLGTQTDSADKKMKLFGLSTDQIGAKMTQAGKIATVGLTLPIAGLAVAATKAASDLNETGNKIDTLFGNASEQVKKFADTAATALGQSKKQALDAAADFAVFGKAAGLAGNDLVGFAEKNVTLAADMASFFNTSPEEAITAIGAAFRGESEPIRRYGVLINEASLKDQALRLGLIKTTTEALNPQARVLAAQALILQQTSAAQGDFAKTSGGLANQSRILNAQFENTIATLGQNLLPIAVKMAGAANDLLKAFNDLEPAQKDLIVAFGLMAAAAGPVLTIGGKLIGVFGSLGSIALDAGRGVISIGKTIGETAGYIKEAGVSVDSLKFAFDNLKAGGVVLGAELGVIAAGLVVITKFIEAAGKAANVTTDELLKMASSGDFFSQAGASFEIIVNGQNRLNVAVQGVEKNLRSTTKTYDEYAAGVLGAAVAAGTITQAQADEFIATGKVTDEFYHQIDVTKRVTDQTRILSREQYNLNISAAGVIEGAENQAKAYYTLDRAMGNVAGTSEDVVQGAKNQADIYGVLDNAIGNSARNMQAATARIKEQQAILADSYSMAIQYTEAQRKQADVQKELDDLNAQIASHGAARSVTVKNEKLNTEELARTQLQLAAAQEDLITVQRKGGETDAEFALRVDTIKGKITEYSTKLGEHTAVVGGATKAELEQKAALEGQIAALQKTDEVTRAKGAFESLTKAFRDGIISEGQFQERSAALNQVAGLYTESALKQATAQEVLMKSFADPRSETWRGQLLLNEKALDGQIEKTGKLADTTTTTVDALTKAGAIPPIEVPITPKPDKAAQTAFATTAQGYANNATAQVALTPKMDEASQAAFQKSAEGYISRPVEVPLTVKPGTSFDAKEAIGKAGIPIEIPLTPKLAPGSKETIQNEAKGYFPGGIEVPIKPKVDMADKTKLGHDLAGDVKFAPTITPKIDTTQAVKDIQAYTTDKVGGIPKEKTTRAIFDSAAATRGANDILKLFGTIPPVKKTTVDVDGKLALQVLDDIRLAYDRIISKTVEIIVKYKTVGEPPPGFQHGVDMIVPPSPTGGSGDYFPFLAAPGERVTVTPAAQQRQAPARGGDTYNYTTNVYNPLAAAMLADKQRRERLARSNSRMGVTQ